MLRPNTPNLKVYLHRAVHRRDVVSIVVQQFHTALDVRLVMLDRRCSL
jgi:hypothetical protein